MSVRTVSGHRKLDIHRPRSQTHNVAAAKLWRDVVAEPLALQAEYAALPESLRDSAIAEGLQEIIDLDLDRLADIRPPRGLAVT